jgi:hypothetical protein
VLIALSGLSGTGKSSVGEAGARRCGAVWLPVDEVEDALLGAGLPYDSSTFVLLTPPHERRHPRRIGERTRRPSTSI